MLLQQSCDLFGGLVEIGRHEFRMIGQALNELVALDVFSTIFPSNQGIRGRSHWPFK